MRFTAGGRWGVAFFILGPAASAVAAVVLANSDVGYGFGDLTPSIAQVISIAAYAGGILALCGIAMMLICREFYHETADDTEGLYDLLAAPPGAFEPLPRSPPRK